MKEQSYKQHIQGMPLDKLQEGTFRYSEPSDSRYTLSEFAKQVRLEANRLAKISAKRCETH